jgi:hypothetical protein
VVDDHRHCAAREWLRELVHQRRLEMHLQVQAQLPPGCGVKRDASSIDTPEARCFMKLKRTPRNPADASRVEFGIGDVPAGPAPRPGSGRCPAAIASSITRLSTPCTADCTITQRVDAQRAVQREELPSARRRA